MQSLLRVVIDTNRIMSAILSARGASAKLIDWLMNRMPRLDDAAPQKVIKAIGYVIKSDCKPL